MFFSSFSPPVIFFMSLFTRWHKLGKHFRRVKIWEVHESIMKAISITGNLCFNRLKECWRVLRSFENIFWEICKNAFGEDFCAEAFGAELRSAAFYHEFFLKAFLMKPLKQNFQEIWIQIMPKASLIRALETGNEIFGIIFFKFKKL